MKLEQIINLKRNNFEIKLPKKMAEGEMDNPCWEGYEPIGLKDDGTPNCVPMKAKIVKDGFPIPSPDAGEDEEKYISRCISDISDEYDTDQAYAICKGKYDE
jgi:hypothetical protein